MVIVEFISHLSPPSVTPSHHQSSYNFPPDQCHFLIDTHTPLSLNCARVVRTTRRPFWTGEHRAGADRTADKNVMEITQLIKCAEREIEMRNRVYPHRVRRGTMSQEEADYEIQCMETILNFIKTCGSTTAQKGNRGS